MLLQEKTVIENEIQKVAQKIVQELDPEKIILFGSRAWGTPGPDSDADFFIVKETDQSTRDVARQVDGLFMRRNIAMDFIVSTPENVQKRLQMGDFFIKKIFEKGRILYER
jgi:predicted nucleotidyltransferase